MLFNADFHSPACSQQTSSWVSLSAESPITICPAVVLSVKEDAYMPILFYHALYSTRRLPKSNSFSCEIFCTPPYLPVPMPFCLPPMGNDLRGLMAVKILYIYALSTGRTFFLHPGGTRRLSRLCRVRQRSTTKNRQSIGNHNKKIPFLRKPSPLSPSLP